MVVRDVVVVVVFSVVVMVVFLEVDCLVKEVEVVDGKDGLLVMMDYDVKWRC